MSQLALFGDTEPDDSRAPDPESWAAFGDARTYRYTLGRCWGDHHNLVTFVMLNPSTADAFTDDRTIGRCKAFARTWGYDGISVVNLYALRSTDPAGLWVVEDPVGPENDAHLRAAFARAAAACTPIIAAWGAHARADRVEAVRALAAHEHAPLLCLARTKAGAPGHPLYLPGDTLPIPWVPPDA